MFLPRRAFDALNEAHAQQVADLRTEVAYLREQLAAASGHNRRMERIDRGLGELEPVRKDRPADEHLPAGVARIVELYEGDASRKALAASIRQARANGDSWATIEADMKANLPEPIIERLEARNG